ncbi:uncharacterized protein Z520_01498 [Fonsecaea multimorphosa CBS 102226]|uniref:Uncharacterized protein n=1 Tax=Fonsecaea multimorphosa CBS 102226 TaxID=1442371 RepID=A0A0D2J0Y1_9EURO|nr:uncharacterized protein Z520_01498 [Fonsecaea multimorphosa CBS 102226]KIY03032.1 hypothetical protein Z520_01498 [Fonsecaea multimorphosa CBS 102226]OAL30627.1 hypothetical protein AYO22_01479 [Fonsecaea multimorphosa]
MESSAGVSHSVQHLAGTVAIVTGGSNGIGAQTVKLLSSHGSNVVIADLESTAGDAEALIASLSHPQNAMFFPTNILIWEEMKLLFRHTIERLGRVDIVIANAGIMESKSVFDLAALDSQGELQESVEGFRVLDVNLKGTFNTLRLALFHMQGNKPCFPISSRGSIVLITSTSGYFGSSGVGAYVASKHGVVGLLRSCQMTAQAISVKVNAVAPFYTPTRTFSNLSEKYGTSELKANSVEEVANAIVQTCLASVSGRCVLVAGGLMREMEATRTGLMSAWLGEDMAEILQSAGKLFAEGGYPLPERRIDSPM